MRALIRIAGRAGFAGMCLFLLALGSSGQDENEKQEHEQSALPENPFLSSPQDEMRRLLLQVKENLKAIDVHLTDAGVGAAPLEDVPSSGLDDLLHDARQQGEQVVSDIDRILEIARELRSSQGPGGPT
jgi:NAD(P)-dependent dehydrogenase (short-subunit alcohol dehydrogenase family)